MLLTIKTKVFISLCLLSLLVPNCNSKSDSENQISVKINTIDSETKKPRAKDTVIVKKIVPGFMYLTRKYGEKSIYYTDSLGSVEIKIDRTKRYKLDVYGLKTYSFAEFAENELKNGQEIVIEVVPPEKKEISW